jgi:hypothetical protein
MGRRALTIAVVLLAVAPAAATAAAPADLWATVNLCDPPARPGAIGVRVSIPREKGNPQQWARIRLQWFDATARAWRLMRSGGDAGWTRLGFGTRLIAGGTTFTFPPPKTGTRIVLRGLVDVEWRKRGEVVDRARLQTTAGHEDASDPHLRVSRSSCEVRR